MSYGKYATGCTFVLVTLCAFYSFFSTVDMPDFGSYGLTDPLAGSLDESESTFENKSGLADDMKFLASMPELCDVTFLVGETREPVCAVKVSLQVLNKVALCP